MKLKKVLSAILAAAMVLSTMSFTVFADSVSVAKINRAEYTDLQSAIDAANENDTVTLLNNITITDTILITKSINLELGDYTISGNADEPVVRMYSPTADTTITVNVKADKGGITNNGYGYAIYAGEDIADGNDDERTNLTIDGGNYSTDGTDCIKQIMGRCTINDGTYSSSFGRTVLNGQRYYFSEFTINGGKFYGFNPACVSVWTGGNDGTLYHHHDIIANGKTAEFSDGWYTVVDGTYTAKVSTKSLCYPSVGAAIYSIVNMEDVANLGVITLLEGDTLSETDAKLASAIYTEPYGASTKDYEFSFILGEYTLEIPVGYVAYNTKLEDNRNVIKIKPAVASVGGVGYVTMDEAIEAAKKAGEINVVGGASAKSTATTAGISVEIPAIIDYAATLTGEQATINPVVNVVSKKTEDGYVTVNTDISIVKEVAGVSNEIQLTGPVSVTITIPEAAGKNVTVIKDGQNDQTVTANEKGTITFTVEHFSPVSFKFEPAAPNVNSGNTAEVKFVETSSDDESTTYNIVLTAASGSDALNRVTSAEMKFDMTSLAGYAVNYEVSKSSDYEVSQSDAGTYLFNLPEGSAALLNSQTGDIVLGKVVVSGYTYKPYEAAATVTLSATEAKAQAEKITDNLEMDITVDGTFKVDYSKQVAAKKLTVNITFPNSIEEKEDIYQSMTVTVEGGGEKYTYKLGNEIKDESTFVHKVKLLDNKYEITNNMLTKDTTYTVTVEGAGYRTARYSVKMTENKVLNFWNNVKDLPFEVEEGKPASAKEVTFLAGEIVKDGQINIYDLSAVVSYFGEIDVDKKSDDIKKAYVKYDLNRDGKINSKDVAYVLVSWGK